MSDLFTELAWLPKVPLDFRQSCRTLLHRADPGRAIAQLAGFALDENQLARLADAIERLRAAGRSLAPLVPFKLGVLGNATLEPLVPALVASAARHGIALECVRADYAQTMAEALTPDSVINRAQPDAVLGRAKRRRTSRMHCASYKNCERAFADTVARSASCRPCRRRRRRSSVVSIALRRPRCAV